MVGQNVRNNENYFQKSEFHTSLLIYHNFSRPGEELNARGGKNLNKEVDFYL